MASEALMARITLVLLGEFVDELVGIGREVDLHDIPNCLLDPAFFLQRFSHDMKIRKIAPIMEPSTHPKTTDNMNRSQRVISVPFRRWDESLQAFRHGYGLHQPPERHNLVINPALVRFLIPDLT